MATPGNTKDKLLQVAFDLIWDNSYGAVSVGDICERAGVNKGSFYHFFESKSDLAIEAYEEHWREKQPDLDRIFSSQVPPLERLQRFCQYVCDRQAEKAREYGRVCGCPYASIGSELATQDEQIRLKSEELIGRGRKYFESAIADAIRQGLVSVTDPHIAAQRVHSIILGMLVEAKVQNNLDVLRDLDTSVMALLGAKAIAV